MSRIRTGAAFTLVEVLVSVAILILLIVLLASMTNMTASVWKNTGAKVDQFRAARIAFESLTDHLSQATLNTYWDYQYPNNIPTQPPTAYIRQSELRFISGQALTLTGSASIPTHACFFQAKLGFILPSGTNGAPDYTGLPNLLNTLGYYVAFGSDATLRPSFVNAPQRYRFRLMEVMQSADALTLYNYTSGTDSNGHPLNNSYMGHEWFTTMLSAGNASHVLAENVLALVLLPRLSPQADQTGNLLAPQYSYDSTSVGQGAGGNGNLDSKNQLPPVVQVTIVVADEASYGRYQSAQGNNNMPAALLQNSSGQLLFQTVGDITPTNSGSAGYANDLQTLQNNLVAAKINYRVFTTNVSIRGAQWSRVQTD
ncbi:MAG: Verru_Chthon cassette protein C [Chthoniobacteraceae bacterium]